MKTAFKILPSQKNEVALHLLMEVGWEGVSLLWYQSAPLIIEGLHIFKNDKLLPGTELAYQLKEIIQTQNLPSFTQCHILYNFKESMLVPDAFFIEKNISSMLDTLYGRQPVTTVFSEAIKAMDAKNIYRVPAAVDMVLRTDFPAAVFQHSNTILLPFLQQNQQQLFCIVYHNSIKVFLFVDYILQHVQFYPYNTPSDVAYHLLNTCQLHQVLPAEITLTLAGFIDQDSNLYQELYRYFLHIRFNDPAADVQLNEEISQLPVHFFGHLINAAQCVL